MSLPAVQQPPVDARNLRHVSIIVTRHPNAHFNAGRRYMAELEGDPLVFVEGRTRAEAAGKMVELLAARAGEVWQLKSITERKS